MADIIDQDNASSEQTPPAAPAQKPLNKQSGNTAVVAILVAIVIALALIGLGYAAFQASDTKTDLTAPADHSIEIKEPTGPADASDIDEAVEEIDSTISQFGGKDFDNTSFSDKELNL